MSSSGSDTTEQAPVAIAVPTPLDNPVNSRCRGWRRGAAGARADANELYAAALERAACIEVTDQLLTEAGSSRTLPSRDRADELVHIVQTVEETVLSASSSGDDLNTTLMPQMPFKPEPITSGPHSPPGRRAVLSAGVSPLDDGRVTKSLPTLADSIAALNASMPKSALQLSPQQPHRLEAPPPMSSRSCCSYPAVCAVSCTDDRRSSTGSLDGCASLAAPAEAAWLYRERRVQPLARPNSAPPIPVAVCNTQLCVRDAAPSNNCSTGVSGQHPAPSNGASRRDMPLCAWQGDPRLLRGR